MTPRLLAPFVLLFSLAMLPAEEAPRLRISRLQGLNFGALVVEAGGGTLELTPEGALKPSPGLRMLGGTPTTVGRVLVEGPPGRSFRLELDPPRPTLAGSSGAPRIERFLLLPANQPLTLDGEGRAEIRVGAVLDLPAGIYAGTYRALPGLQIRVRFVEGVGETGQSPALFLPIQGSLRSPMTMDNLKALHFGDLVPASSGGELRVEADGGFRWMGSEPATFLTRRPAAARFRLQGATGSGYSLQLPQQDVQIRSSGGTLIVRRFTTEAPLEGRIPAGGLEFGVGATLVVPPNAATGAYVGTFRVEIAYN